MYKGGGFVHVQVIRTRGIKWWILGEKRCIPLIMAFGDRVRAFADGSGDRVVSFTDGLWGQSIFV